LEKKGFMVIKLCWTCQGILVMPTQIIWHI